VENFVIERVGVQGIQNRHNETFLVVMSASLVAGMVVALILIFLWRRDPAAMTQGSAYHLAVLVCSPFFLVKVVNALTDSTVAMVLTAGTIVVANGSLYAGLAAFVYWAVTSRSAKSTP
jgi:hypothetical protein